VSRACPNVVDSSAWLAYFADEPGAAEFAAAIEDTRLLVVPAVCLLEVFEVVARQRGDGDALQAVALMQQGEVVELDATLAFSAARIGLDQRRPMADSIVYATARAIGGTVWTQDSDVDGLPDVRYVPKGKSR